LRAAVREEHTLHVGVSKLRQALRQLNRGGVGVTGVAVREGECTHLSGGGLGELLTSVSDSDIPERREAVAVFASAYVGEGGALALDEDQLVALVPGRVLRVEKVGLVARDQGAVFAVVHGVPPTVRDFTMPAPMSGYGRRLIRAPSACWPRAVA